MQEGPVTLEKHGTVGVVRITHPPVNALSQPVRAGLKAAFERIAEDAAVTGVVVWADGRTFVAGADITEFSAPTMAEPGFHEVFDLVEGFDRPIVAALHGTALGGGLELALACHYRVALDSAKIGLPEVHLGILPGAGGTQRLPRLAGVKAALDMMLSGEPVPASTARAKGIVDEVIETGLFDRAVAQAEALAQTGAPLRRTSGLAAPAVSEAADMLEQARDRLQKRPTGNPAPARIIDCVEAAVRQPFRDGVTVEKRLVEECRLSPESAALQHRFFAEREAAKVPGLPKDLPLREIRRVGVVGAGTMGGGIAMNFANVGIPVVIVEAEQEALDRGLGIVRSNYEATVAKGRLTQDECERRMERLMGSLDYADLADCDLVIEAVFENMELKKSVCARLGEVCKAGAIIASNTSTLDVDALAEASGRPADVLGMHFFSPANVMRLLEVVRGEATTPDAIATVVKLARTIGKVPVVSGVCFGFIGNRMLEHYLRESEFLMMEGATPAQIDAAIQSLGLPMGPCRMLDLAGTDVAAKVVQEQEKIGALSPDPSYRAVVLKLLELGRHGQKAGAGYYRYEGRKPVSDPEMDSICEELAARHGIERRIDIPDEEIIERCMYPMINEGAKILEEGIAYRPGDIDVVWMNGYGFPDFLGGPMFWADSLGLEKVLDTMRCYGRTLGNRYDYWTPAALLERLVQEERQFQDWRLDSHA